MNRKNRLVSLSLMGSLHFAGWGGDTDPSINSQASKISSSIADLNEARWIEKTLYLDPKIISLLCSPQLPMQALNFIKEIDLYVLNTASNQKYSIDSSGALLLGNFIETGCMLNSLKDKFPQGFPEEVLELVGKIFKYQEDNRNLQNFMPIIINLDIDDYEKTLRLSKIDSLIKEGELAIQIFTEKINSYFPSKNN